LSENSTILKQKTKLHDKRKNAFDNKAIRKRLLKSNLHKRRKEQNKLKQELQELTSVLREKLSRLDWYILWKFACHNVKEMERETVETHEKKMRNLTKNTTLPFLPDGVIRDLSSYLLSDEEAGLLMNGLNYGNYGNYGIPPSFVSKTNIFTTLEIINRFATSEQMMT